MKELTSIDPRGLKALITAIVKGAVYEYCNAKKKLIKDPDNVRCKVILEQNEIFFRSGWFTNCAEYIGFNPDGEELIKILHGLVWDVPSNGWMYEGKPVFQRSYASKNSSDFEDDSDESEEEQTDE